MEGDSLVEEVAAAVEEAGSLEKMQGKRFFS